MSDKKISRDLLLVTISLFLWGLGEGQFIILQPIYLKETWKADPVMIGVILSAMGVFMTLTQAPAGWISDRIGPRPAMWGSWILGTLSAAVMALALDLPVFLTGMFLYGLTSFVIAPMNLYITGVRGSWSIEQALTVPNAAFNAGMVAGSLSGGLVANTFGFRTIYMIASGLFLVSTMVVLFCHKPPQDAHHEATANRPDLLRNPRFMGLLALIFVTMFALYLPQPFTSLFLEQHAGLSLPLIGLLGSIGFLGNAVITFGMQRLTAPMGFLAGQVFVAVYASIMWLGNSPWWYGVGVFFLGGYRLAHSMMLAYSRRYIRSSETGTAYGLIETANGATIILAPTVAGFLFHQGPRLIFSVSLAAIFAVILINLGLLAARRRRGERRVVSTEVNLR